MKATPERVATFTANGAIVSADSFEVYVAMARQEGSSLRPHPPVI